MYTCTGQDRYVYVYIYMYLYIYECVFVEWELPSRSRTGLLDHRAWLDCWYSMRDDDDDDDQQQQQQLGCWWWSLPDKGFEIAAATSAKRRRIWHPIAREITPPPPPPTTTTTTTEHAKKSLGRWFLVDHHFACFCLCTFANSEDEEFDSMIPCFFSCVVWCVLGLFAAGWY